MLHILSHLAVPLAVAFVFFRAQVVRATLVMVATMIVDVDHLLADPIYDPERCSIGFHPLHAGVPIVLYAIVFGIAVLLPKRLDAASHGAKVQIVRLISLGLLIHMVLDGLDCVL